jgi:hypothetical protein
MDTWEGSFVDPFTLHKYLYASANPVNRIDPSGNDSLAELTEAAAIYIRNVAVNARTAFAAGSTAVGLFFNALGAQAQTYGRAVIQLFTRINSEQVFEEIEEDVPIIFRTSTRVIDFFVKAKDGVSNLLIEAKYGLPRSGPALARMVGQLTNAIGSGKARQVVIWTLKEPAAWQVGNAINALGDLAPQVQFVHGIEGLWNYLEFYFGRGL